MSTKHELIKYLSKEIETHSSQLMTYRSRIGFVVLVGPFLLMSSFLIATGGGTGGVFETKALRNWDSIVAMVSVAILYLGLGYLFYEIDIGAEAQCNKWRSLILCLSKEDHMTREGGVTSRRNKEFESHPRALTVYAWAFSLMLGIFINVAYLLMKMLGVVKSPASTCWATMPAWVPLIVADGYLLDSGDHKM